MTRWRGAVWPIFVHSIRYPEVHNRETDKREGQGAGEAAAVRSAGCAQCTYTQKQR